MLVSVGVSIFAEESLAGVPGHAFPGFLHAWGVSSSNDSTVYSNADRYRKHDNFRTGAFSAYARFAEEYIWSADYSLLTDKLGNRRSDEISMSIGRRYLPQLSLSAGKSAQVYYGLGLRLHGDFSGQSVQNALHTITSGIDVEMPYDQSNTLLFVYGRAHWMQAYAESLSYELSLSTLLGGNGLWQNNILLRHNMEITEAVTVSMLLRWRKYFDQAGNGVAEGVLDREAGWWPGISLRYGNIALQLEHNLTESRTQTMIAYALPLNGPLNN